VTVLYAELSQRDSAKTIFDFATDKHLPIDILVNNAGVGMSGAIEDYAEQTLLEIIVLNIFSLTALFKYFAP
jgi:short-subunit dehydrogenase